MKQGVAQGEGNRLLTGGRNDMRPWVEGQGVHGEGEFSRQGAYAEGQSARPYPQGQGQQPFEQRLHPGGQNVRPYSPGHGEEGNTTQAPHQYYHGAPYKIETEATIAPHILPHHFPPSDLLRTLSYPPSSLPPPDHLEAPPPHARPSYRQPSSLPHYQSHHTHHPAGHAPLYYDQQETPMNPYSGGSGLATGGWGQQYPSSGHTSLGSSSHMTSGSTGVPYRYLEGEGSSELLLSYPSSQPSSLGALSDQGGAYGRAQHLNPVRFDAPPFPEGQGERCHSYPLSSYPLQCYDPRVQGAGGVQGTQPLYHRQGSASSYMEEGSRHSAGLLASDLRRHLVITEDTPAGEDEQHGGDDAKHTLLTMLDSDRIEVLEQPRDLEVEVDQKAILTCKARALDAGGEGVKQQWYRGEEALEGETRMDLVLASVERKDAGMYYCVITHPDDSSVSKSSRGAQLTIKTGK